MAHISTASGDDTMNGATMVNMTPAHAKPARRDHLWVLAVIAAFALFDVWESWTQVGNKSGFAHGTGWTLTVIVEVFAAYCLYAWFGAPGVRSRKFAMWSAIVALTLSLIGQGASVLAVDAVPPIGVRVFVRDLPVVVLAMIAVLIHLRRLDRADAEDAVRAHAEAQQEAQAEAAAADDRAALRARLEALVSDLDTAHLAASEAGRREAEALTRAETLQAKLAKANAHGKRTKAVPAGTKSAREEDITTEFRALDELQKDPSLRGPRMGAELGRRIGVSSATGRRLHAKLTAQDHSADQSDERSGERS